MSGLRIHHKTKLHIGWVFTALLVIALVVCSWYAYRWYTVGAPLPFVPPLASAQPMTERSVLPDATIDDYTVAANQPRFLSIPALGVNKSRIIPVDVNSNGQLGNPKNVNDVAWYQSSATPGTGYGAVLIDNHQGGCTDGGVFENIEKLKAGGTISIERGDGESFTYRVVSNTQQERKYVTEAKTHELLDSVEADKEGLSIIACAGNWIPQQKQFNQQITLRAVLIGK